MNHIDRMVTGGVIVRINEQQQIEILLIQRSPTDHWPFHWEFPRGGCNKTETKKSCVKREVKEETGLDVIPIRFIDFFDYVNKEDKRSRQYNFLCLMKNPNQPVKLSREHAGMNEDEPGYKWIQSVGEAELLLSNELKRTVLKVFQASVPTIGKPATKNKDVEITEDIVATYLANL